MAAVEAIGGAQCNVCGARKTMLYPTIDQMLLCIRCFTHRLSQVEKERSK